MNKDNKYFQKHAKKDFATEEYYSEQAKKLLAKERKMFKEISAAREKLEREELNASITKARVVPVEVKEKRVWDFINRNAQNGE